MERRRLSSHYNNGRPYWQKAEGVKHQGRGARYRRQVKGAMRRAQDDRIGPRTIWHREHSAAR
jgi:hypothetical protein